MSTNIYRRIVQLHERALGEILTLAEIGLSPAQFRPFKKKVFAYFHDELKPSIAQVFQEESSDQGRAHTGNLEGKECCDDT